MGGFWDKLNDISNVLDDVSNTLDDMNSAVGTTSHGVRKVQETGEKIGRIASQVGSDKDKRDRKKIKECEIKASICTRRTFIFCILMIAVTVLVCIFL